MGIIIQVREKFGYVMVIVIALAILAFLLMDAVSSNPGSLTGRGDTLATINGTKISYDQFNKVYLEDLEDRKLQSGRTSFDDSTTLAMRETSWNQFVTDYLLEQQYEELGLALTEEEEWDMLQGETVPPDVSSIPVFANENTGQFDPNRVVAYLQNLDKANENQKLQWKFFEKQLFEQRMGTKYSSLITRGLYVPGWMASEDFIFARSSVSFEYVSLDYGSINDNDIEVTDEELNSYLKSNTAKFTSKAERSFKYVAFDVVPSAEDTLKMEKSVAELMEEMKERDDDSLFIRLNSDVPFDYAYYSEGENEEITDSIFNLDTGAVIGPYYQDGYFIAAEMLDRKSVPDSVQVKEMFFDMRQAVSNGEQDFRRQSFFMADSLVRLINDGADFDEIAVKYSVGDSAYPYLVGKSPVWVKKGAPNPKLRHIQFQGDAAIQLIDYHQEGDVFLFTSPQNGYHIFQVVKSTPSKEAVKVAFLKKEIFPSRDTEKKLYADASNFATKHQTAEAFNNAASEGFDLNEIQEVKKDDITIDGLGQARELIKWAFQAEEGDVSDVKALNSAYVIALLTGKKEEGTPKLEDVRREVAAEVIKQKKAALLKEKMTTAGAPNAELSAIADKLGKEPKQISSVTVREPLVGASFEPAVAGKAVTLNDGEKAGPIEGNSGVFVIQLTTKTLAAPGDDLSGPKVEMLTTLQEGVLTNLVTSLQDEAEIVDNRLLFYQ